MAPVTLITGGSTGIGAATTRRLLDAGHRVAVTGRDENRLAAFADCVVFALNQPADWTSTPSWCAPIGQPN